VPALCIAAAGAVVARLAVGAFTLGWTHSVEKIPWEEEWRLEPGGLRLVAARVRGTGAGMEPPPEAKLEDGWWRWTPSVPLQPRIVLRRAGVTADWRLCTGGGCRDLGAMVPADADPVVLESCPDVSP
jgi:hypothetical protein